MRIFSIYTQSRSPPFKRSRSIARKHINLVFNGELQQVISSGCDITGESDSDERRETCTWCKYCSHKSCCRIPFSHQRASPSHPCAVTGLPSTELSSMLSCLSHRRGPAPLKPFRHTGFIWLKGNNLSNSSPVPVVDGQLNRPQSFQRRRNRAHYDEGIDVAIGGHLRVLFKAANLICH